MVRFGPNGAGFGRREQKSEHTSLEARQRDALLDVLTERRPYHRGRPAVQHLGRRRRVRHPLLLVQMQLEVQL
jgi:hypothetical protein